MARPPKSPAEKRSERLGFRLTAAERAELEQHAAAFGITMPDYVRRRVLGHRMPPFRAVALAWVGIADALNRIGVNLNQIAHHMNAGRGAPPDLAALIARIEAELNRLDHASFDEE